MSYRFDCAIVVVISGAAESYRAQLAMAAVEEYLIRAVTACDSLRHFRQREVRRWLYQGLRSGRGENGGQYTHAALWTLIAFAILGDGERAGELFSLLNPVNHRQRAPVS